MGRARRTGNTSKPSRTSIARPRRSRRSAARAPIEAGCLLERTQPLDENLRQRVIGQDRAIDALVCSYARLLSGLRDPSRPLLTALLLGPTGVGKTETARALAQTLFGSERAMTRVNCEEYAHGHELAKLLGSPPGYVGSQVEPLLSQRRIDEPHRLLRDEQLLAPETAADGLVDAIFTAEPDAYQSIILFDEIEKAHPMVWNALLGILEDGMLTLGNNDTTDFTRSMILLTSNAGSREMSEILEHRPVGFGRENETEQLEAATVTDTALAAARRIFPLEFLNRFDEILVYGALEHEHLLQIFDKFLADIHERAIKQAGMPLLIKVGAEARELIVEHGTDVRFGARPLRRAMERELVDPLSRLIASHKIAAGDVVEVERSDDALQFFRSPRSSTALVA